MLRLPFAYWKGTAVTPPVDGLRILLDMSNFQDVIDGTDTVWVDQDLTDGQANDQSDLPGPFAGLTIVSGKLVGGWEAVIPVTGPFALTPVGPRNYSVSTTFEVGGTGGSFDDVLYLPVMDHLDFQCGARIRYRPGPDQFDLVYYCGGFQTVSLTPDTPYTLTWDVYEDGGVAKADFTLNGTPLTTAVSVEALNEIAQITPFLINQTASGGVGLTFKWGGFSLYTTT